MSYWRKCLSTGDYQYIATSDPAPGDIVVPWWEVELARKDKRIAELEARLENAEANYQFMVCRAADEKLDGYRELGQRAADAENERDELKRRITELEFDKANLVDRIIGLEIHKTGVIGQGNRIAELEEQNRNMMALFRDFYDLEFNRGECWEIIKKYGGDA